MTETDPSLFELHPKLKTAKPKASLRVVLTSHGSTGDIYPMIAFGQALQHEGHYVTFATINTYGKVIEDAGIEFYELPPYWEQNQLSYWMGRLQQIKSPILQLNELYRAALPFIPAMLDRIEAVLEYADVLVSSYLFPITKGLADRMGVTFVTFAFAHNTVPSKHYPPENLPRFKWLPRFAQYSWNRLLWNIGNRVVDSVINRTIAKVLAEKGLPKVRNFFSKPADLVLVAVSEKLMKPPYKFDPRFTFVGYSRWQNPPDETLDKEIAEFTGGEKVPVLTFGSMVYRNPEEVINRFIKHWPEGRKIIMQRGWAEFDCIPQRNYLKIIGPTCHDALFRHASIVIHHGGAGTTASVLYAGKPHIVVPHIGDQDFFGKEVARLGVGVRLHKKVWPEKLHKTVSKVTAHEPYQQTAVKLRQLLLQEDGPSRAVAELEAFIFSRKSRQAQRQTTTATPFRPQPTCEHPTG